MENNFKRNLNDTVKESMSGYIKKINIVIHIMTSLILLSFIAAFYHSIKMQPGYLVGLVPLVIIYSILTYSIIDSIKIILKNFLVLDIFNLSNVHCLKKISNAFIIYGLISQFILTDGSPTSSFDLYKMLMIIFAGLIIKLLAKGLHTGIELKKEYDLTI